MILDKLERMENFTSQEKEIAKYMLANPSSIKDLTTEELAEVTFTSQATVVRLCKKLDTKGYHDFKLKFLTEYLETERVRELLKDEPVTNESTYHDIIDIIPNMYDSAITNTKLKLNAKTMNRIFNRLKQANKVDIYGQGISYSIAKQASFKFLSIGINSMAHDGMNEHYIMANEDYSRMVAILISFTGKNSSIIEIAKYLKERGIYVVGISGDGTSELVEHCSEIIQIDNRKLVLSMEVVSSVIASQYILDIFFSMLLANDYERNIRVASDILNYPFKD